MKIREYAEYTLGLEMKFELLSSYKNDGFIAELYDLFDAIELRHGDVQLWTAMGLTFDDNVPEAPLKVIVPEFEINRR